jgi:cytochrome b
MTVGSVENGGRLGARSLQVWDPLVRITHWTVALCVLLNGAVLDAEGDLHAWLGYAVAILIGVRTLWGLIGPRPARFASFPPRPFAAIRHLREILKGHRVAHLSHNPAGALMIYNIWATLAVLCATGVMMGTITFFGVAWVEDLHRAAFNWLIVSVALHVAGVIAETWRSGVPLVRAMVDGRKRIPEGTRLE